MTASCNICARPLEVTADADLFGALPVLCDPCQNRSRHVAEVPTAQGALSLQLSQKEDSHDTNE